MTDLITTEEDFLAFQAGYDAAHAACPKLPNVFGRTAGDRAAIDAWRTYVRTVLSPMEDRAAASYKALTGKDLDLSCTNAVSSLGNLFADRSRAPTYYD